MKILFLDDELWRHEMARKHFADDEVYSVLSIAAFLRSFHKENWDLICLDHDLGSSRDGKDAARFVSTVEALTCPVWIHSWNALEARNMHLLLKNYPGKVRRTPFGPDSLKTFDTWFQRAQ